MDCNYNMINCASVSGKWGLSGREIAGNFKMTIETYRLNKDFGTSP